jgi:hypothetical protein
VLVALSVSWLSLSSRGAARPAADGTLPQLMLWAWERPADLRQLAPGPGVAFLSQTLTLRNGAMAIEPRRNPLRVAPHTPLVAVTRIETDGHGALLSRTEVAATAWAIDGWRWSACEGGAKSDLPRRAFVLLHRQFPRSEWAMRTKYWYD